MPSQLYYNRGCLEEGLRGVAAGGAKKAVVVTDVGIASTPILQRVLSCLRGEGVEVEVFHDVHPDPDMECIRNGVEFCNTVKPDTIIALGGGSPIDAAKFIRVQYEHPEMSLEGDRLIGCLAVKSKML